MPLPLQVTTEAAAEPATSGAAAAPAAGSGAAGPRNLDKLQCTVEERLGVSRAVYAAAGGVRVRQHVNPLKRELQIPTDAPEWSQVYDQPERPIVLDLGCGYGRFLLALTQAMPGHNMLGLEIREPIIERANRWAEHLQLQRSVLFLRGNATITLEHTLADYPGSLDLVCVQFPDPHFKARHKKRRTVQKQTVEAVARLMPPGGRVFLQSDVLEAAEHMRDTFEEFGSAWFAPCPELHSGPVFHAASEPRPAAQQQQQVAAAAADAADAAASSSSDDGGSSSGEEAQQQRQQQPAWQSQWAALGWLQDNPLGVPTEREVLTTEQGLPVYRVMLRCL
ncbi:tRNA (guanine-N(7)-)-methyltransferase isoform A [Chlorella sorokiniana]|uniref:tRNA (guanine(46)-N(7))-methyltransferase n=1 Tax=Chlorella sorokiniana TaxID=3076 RepID=A0A2P6TVC7_CHLSO|nr:tRNA (guanine-N(7)-)-methyltransferase isoform A [Chlorella sorokiniana]|eukprot:PRW58022.1 tRNA (guanine-N(7)-)-methyltransferase isoform A [Chlorella sorokiniana]